MAGRTQPIVYKPTNVTKYADAYANRLDAAAAEAKKKQAERNKRRQKMSDELDVSMAGTFVAPAAQDAWDMYREEKMKYLQENPNNIKQVIREAAEYKKALGGIDTEYRNKSAAIDPSTQHGVDYAMRESVKGLPEGADYNDIDQVLKAVLSPFNMVTDKQDLETGISDTMAAVLEDIYNSDERGDFFVEDETITNTGDGYESTKFARNIIPTQKKEVARRVFARLEDKYLIEAGFRAENDNDFNLEEEISQRAMGLAPFAGRLIKEDDRERRGGGTTIDLNVDISEEDTTGTYEDSKAQGVGHFRDVKLSGLDTYVGGDFTYKDEDGNQTIAKIKSLEMGKQGVNLGKPVAVLEISSEGKGGVKLVDKLFSEIKGELLNQVKYTGEKKDGIVGKIKEWEVEANKQAEAGKFDEKEILSYIDDAAKIWKGGGSKEERLAKIKEFLGRDDIEYVSFGFDDIKIGGERINFDDDTYSDDEMAIIWESKSKKPSSYKGGQETREEKKARLIKEAAEGETR